MRRLALLLLLAACHKESKIEEPPAPPAPPASPFVQVTDKAVLVEGQPVLTLTDGQVDPAELEGGAMGMKLPRLQALLEKVPSRRPKGEWEISVQPGTTYKLLTQLVYTGGQAKLDRLIVSLGDQHVRLTLPKMASAAMAGGPGDGAGGARLVPVHGPGEPAEAEKPRLQLVVAATRDKLLVWSVSGLEGSLQAPAAELGLGDTAKLESTLAAIESRHPDDEEAIFIADYALTMAQLVPLMAIEQKHFAELVMSAGFQ